MFYVSRKIQFNFHKSDSRNVNICLPLEREFTENGSHRGINKQLLDEVEHDIMNNHKNYNFLSCDWFKNVLFSTNSLAKLLSDSLLLDSLLLDSLLSDSSISQSHSKM